MAEYNKYTSTKAYAMEYGTFLGIGWIIVFALYICGLRTLNGLPLVLGMLTLVSLPAASIYLALRFKKQDACEEGISLRRSIFFSLMMHLYASLLTSVAALLYFQIMDNGAVINSMYNVINSPYAVSVYKQAGMEDVLEMGRSNLDALSQLSPLEIAFALFNQNIMVSIILSILTGFVAANKKYTK